MDTDPVPTRTTSLYTSSLQPDARLPESRVSLSPIVMLGLIIFSLLGIWAALWWVVTSFGLTSAG